MVYRRLIRQRRFGARSGSECCGSFGNCNEFEAFFEKLLRLLRKWKELR